MLFLYASLDMYSAVLQEFFGYISEVTGVQNLSLRDTWDVADTLFCEVSLS